MLAQQLTHVELERLSMIGPEEFVQAFAKETSDVSEYKFILDCFVLVVEGGGALVNPETANV